MSALLINQGWTDNLGDIAIGEVMERALAEFSPITVEFAPIVMKKNKRSFVEDFRVIFFG